MPDNASQEGCAAVCTNTRQSVSVVTHFDPADPSVDLIICDLGPGHALHAQLTGAQALVLGLALSAGGRWVHEQECRIEEAEG